MGDNLNISVLCAAKEEYLNQLKYYLAPIIQEGFESIYEDALLNEPSAPLRQFQIFLKQIPKWNQSILDGETKRIRDKCTFLMDLVTAIFVSHVKILASVRLGGDHKNIKLKIPTSEIFIHGIYVQAAEYFYYEPFPFSDFRLHKNKEIIKQTIEETIEETISSLIPIQDILQEYLSSAFSSYTKPQPPPPPEDVAPALRVFSGQELMGSKEFSIGDQPTFAGKLQHIEEVRTIPTSLRSEPDPIVPQMFEQPPAFDPPAPVFEAPPPAFEAPAPSYEAPAFEAPPPAPVVYEQQPPAYEVPPPSPVAAAEPATDTADMSWLESPKGQGVSFFGDSGSLPD